jgi:outer membrane immunogenic protein
MSRTKILAASLIVFAAGIGAAAAGDIPSSTPPPSAPVFEPTPAYSWAGPYVGLMGGYNWGHANLGPAPTTATASGFSGGLYAGYNFQPTRNFVLGVEADAGLGGPKGSGAGVAFSTPWNGTLRARAGVAFDRFLVYGTGGLAFGSVKGTAGGVSDTRFKTGWTAGAGLEAAIASNLTARLEYRYTDLGTATLATAPGSTVDLNSSAVLVGVGVKF